MGIFGAFLRWIQVLNISEPDTHLVKLGSPWSYALVIFFLLFTVLLILWIRSFRAMNFPQKFPDVFSRELPIYSIASYAIGAIMALGGVLSILHALSLSGTIFDIVLGFFALVCAISASTFILTANKRENKGSGVAQSVIIIFFLCFWLIAAYKFSASDPVYWNFAPKLLAISATILAFYFIEGFVFNKPKPLLSLFFCQLGTFLCIITLADSYPIGEQLITIAFAMMMLLLSYAQISNTDTKEVIEHD